LRSEEAVEKKAMAINKVQDSKSGVGVWNLKSQKQVKKIGLIMIAWNMVRQENQRKDILIDKNWYKGPNQSWIIGPPTLSWKQVHFKFWTQSNDLLTNYETES
jgi:hypothetical protein